MRSTSPDHPREYPVRFNSKRKQHQQNPKIVNHHVLSYSIVRPTIHLDLLFRWFGKTCLPPNDDGLMVIYHGRIHKKST